MEIFLPNIWLYLPVLLLSIVTTYVIGWLITSFFSEFRNKNNILSNTFVNLTLGFVTLVTIFAVIWTKGNSVMWLSVLSFFLFFWLRKKKNVDKEPLKITKQIWIELGISILSASVLFFLGYWLFFMRTGGDVFIDYPYYANVSNKLILSHVETSSLHSQDLGASFYHWGEIWFNALWAFVFQLNHYYTLLLVTYMYFATLLVLGAASIVKNIFPYHNLLCLLLGLSFLFFVPVLSIVFPLGAVSQHPKYFIIAIFILWAFMGIQTKDVSQVALALLLIVPFSTVMAPGCLAFLFFYVAYDKYMAEGKTWYLIFNKYVFSILVVVILFAVFYKIQPLLGYSETNQSSELKSKIDNPLFSIFTFSAKQSFFFIIRFVPILIALFFLKKKTYIPNNNFKEILPIIVCVLLSGFVAMLVGSITRLFILDGRQIAVNYGLIVTDITLFVSLIYMLSLFSSRKSRWLVMIALNVFYLFASIQEANKYNIYGKTGDFNPMEITFYQEIQNSFTDLNKPINFAYFRSYEGMETGSWLRRINFIIPLEKMVHISPYGFYAPFCLSALDIPDDTKEIVDEREESQLWKFVQKQKTNGSFVSTNDAMLDFLIAKKVEYIVVESGATLPDFLHGRSNLISSFQENNVYKVNF